MHAYAAADAMAAAAACSRLHFKGRKIAGQINRFGAGDCGHHEQYAQPHGRASECHLQAGLQLGGGIGTVLEVTLSKTAVSIV